MDYDLTGKVVLVTGAASGICYSMLGPRVIAAYLNADMILYLASDRSTFVTGSEFIIDR